MVTSTKLIRIDFSDGVKDSVPENTSDHFPKPGTDFDYYRTVPTDDPKHVRWMTVCGQYLKSETILKESDFEYKLAGFPESYTFLEHNKSMGTEKKHRTDMYLFGHPSGGRFRSTNEFLPHLLWLASDLTHDTSKCPCKLCSGAKTIGETGIISKRKRSRPALTGMSELGKANMEKAQQEMAKDLEPAAHVYRIGEIVLRQDLPYLVSKQTFSQPVDKETTPSQALALHTYVLLSLQPPYTRAEGVPHNDLLPHQVSSIATGDNCQILTHSASPIAKFNLERSATSILPGPCYVGWFLGAEKIWSHDIVRLNQPDEALEILSINHIVQNKETRTVMVRGDLFKFHDEPRANKDRQLPVAIAAVEQQLSKHAHFENSEGLEFDLPLGQVRGRYYAAIDPQRLKGDGIPLTIRRGRCTNLPADLQAAAESVFEQQDEAEDDLALSLGGGQ